MTRPSPSGPGKRTRSGQVRLVELTIAASMVVAVLLLVMHFTRPLRSVYIRETGDLRRLAHNLLGNLAEAGAFERALSSALKGDGTWEGRMRMLVSSSLPPGVVFRMEIYSVDVLPNATVRLVRLDRGGVTNVDQTIELLESESVHYTYTCVRDPDSVRGKMLYVVLVIGYAG